MEINNETLSNSVKQIMLGILSELPKDQNVYRGIGKYQWNAEQMIKEIEESSDVAKQYICDILRVSRDIIHDKSEM